MGGIRQRGTAPELEVRRLLREAGRHFRTSNRDLPGSPDAANRRWRWAIFVHGCYWHRHSGCAKATIPKRNAAFWLAKFAANVERDRRSVRELRARGYHVLTIWECQLVHPKRVSAAIRRLPDRAP
ncbi:MAG: very short patch repair endonuclease [Myxococcota bacterium]|nr:very short patch repair endonuclease [Myxococcota bacterium]